MGDQHGDTGGEGFQDDVAVCVSFRREDKGVEVGEGAGERFPVKDAAKDGSGQIATQKGLLVALPHQAEMEGPCGERGQLGVNGDEPANVLFGAEPADVSDTKDVVALPDPFRWMKERRVDTALHQAAGFAGKRSQEGDKLGVGGDRPTGVSVEAGDEAERGVLYGSTDRLARGNPGGEAAGGVLMNVGMPGGENGKPATVGEDETKEAAIARAG